MHDNLPFNGFATYLSVGPDRFCYVVTRPSELTRPVKSRPSYLNSPMQNFQYEKHDNTVVPAPISKLAELHANAAFDSKKILTVYYAMPMLPIIHTFSSYA